MPSLRCNARRWSKIAGGPRPALVEGWRNNDRQSANSLRGLQYWKERPCRLAFIATLSRRNRDGPRPSALAARPTAGARGRAERDEGEWAREEERRVPSWHRVTRSPRRSAPARSPERPGRAIWRSSG